MTNSWAIHDNYMFKKKDIFCFITNSWTSQARSESHELTINYSLIKIVRVMTKKDYMKHEIQAMGIQEESALLAYSVQSSGLGDGEELSQDDTSGNAWDDAMSRGSIWDEE